MTSQVYEISKPIIQKFQPSASTGTKVCLIIHEGEVIKIDPNQSWFWSREWQAGEKKVDQYIERGEIETFDSMKEFLSSLRN
jgi:hypothetical protein